MYVANNVFQIVNGEETFDTALRIVYSPKVNAQMPEKILQSLFIYFVMKHEMLRIKFRQVRCAEGLFCESPF